MEDNKIITGIESINLNSAEIGKDINDRLESINYNFNNIVNSEFLKGVQGSNYVIKKAEYNEDKYIFDDNIYYKYTEDGVIHYKELDSVYLTSSLSNIVPSIHTESLKIIYFNCIFEDEKFIAVSSLPIIYYDKVFYNSLNDKVNTSELVDQSCVLYWGGDKFQRLNSFPTIYFNENVGDFCWRWNGIDTNIIAKGPQGLPGVNGNSYVGMGDVVGDNIVELKSFMIWNNGNFSTISSSQMIDKCKKFGYNPPSEGDLIIYFARITDNGKTNLYMSASPLHLSNDGDLRYLVYFNRSSSINGLFDVGELNNSMSSLYNSEICPGLFIPYTELKDGSQSAHLLYNDKDDNLHLSPIKNIYDEQFETDNKKMIIDYNIDSINTNNIYVDDEIHMGNPHIKYTRYKGLLKSLEDFLIYNKDTDSFDIYPRINFKGGVNINNTSNGTGEGVSEEEIKNILNTEFNIQPGTIEMLTSKITKNETDISSLQINPEEIKASVISSIKSDNEFREDIASIVITSDSITSTVESKVTNIMDNYATKTHVQEEISKISIGDGITMESLERLVEEKVSEEGNIESVVNEYVSSLKLDENYATLSSVESLSKTITGENGIQKQIETINGSIVDLTSKYTSIINGNLDNTTGLGLLLSEQSSQLGNLSNNFNTLSAGYNDLGSRVGTLEQDDISMTNRFNELNTNFNNLGNTYISQSKLDNAGLFLGDNNIIMWGNAIKIATTKDDLNNVENYTALFDNGKISANLLQVNELQCYNKKSINKQKTTIKCNIDKSGTLVVGDWEILGFSHHDSTFIKYVAIPYAGEGEFNPHIPMFCAYCYNDPKMIMINNVYGVSVVNDDGETIALDATSLDSRFYVVLKDENGYIWRTDGKVSNTGNLSKYRVYNINDINFVPVEEVQQFMKFDNDTKIIIATDSVSNLFTNLNISVEVSNYTVDVNESVPKTTINRNKGGEVIMYWPNGSVMNCKIIKTAGSNVLGCVEYFFPESVCSFADVMMGYTKLDSLQYLKRIDHFAPELSFNISPRIKHNDKTLYTIDELNSMTNTSFANINEWFDNLRVIYIGDSNSLIDLLKPYGGWNHNTFTIYSVSGNDTKISDGSDLRNYLYKINNTTIGNITIDGVDNLHKYLSTCSSIDNNVLFNPTNLGDHLLVLDYNEEKDTNGNIKKSITLVWYNNINTPVIKGVKSITSIPQTTNNNEWIGVQEFLPIIKQE